METTAQTGAVARRRPVIAGNWKMNKTVAEAVTLAQQVSFKENGWDGVDVVMCPPFTCLKSVWNVLAFDKSPIELGAQDVFWEDEGAFTGAVSPAQLAELRCAYCIVGHSERRAYFHESDEDVARKVAALLKKSITPIMCCGEDADVRDAGGHLAFVEAQVRAGLAGLDAVQVGKCIVAYEPVWAIGTGAAAAPEQAQEMCAHIRAVVADMVGADAAAKLRVLYGGSMKPENAAWFLELPDCDGGLIGGAALDAGKFAELVECAKRADDARKLG